MDDYPAHSLHRHIYQLRKRRQLTQEQMADRLALSVNGYAKIEHGKTRLSVERLGQLARIFEVSIHELLNPHQDYPPLKSASYRQPYAIKSS